MKNAVFIIVIFLLFVNNGAGQSTRIRQLIDFGWRFSQTDTVGAEKISFNDAKWRILDLPHDWSIENEFIKDAPTGGGGGYLPTGVGWYRRQFPVSKSDLKKNSWIEFDGVYQNSDVWINGQHLGHYPNGYMSFYYDLTPFLKSGKNIIAVRVDNSLQPNTRFYSGSGIYRNVWLNSADPLHVAQWGSYITAQVVDSSSAIVTIKTKIENNSGVSRDAILRSTIVDAKGNVIEKTETPISASSKTKKEIEQKLTVLSPRLWSLETPYLYSLHSTILDKGKIIDEVVSSFGIRDIKYDVNQGFLLNGKHVKMNGVCLHHDAGSVGAAVSEATWIRRLRILKEMGCNAIRTSHNPVAPEFLDLCDKMGFLVMDEIFDEWTAGKVKYGYHNYFDQWAQHDVMNFIHRDRNHPSVVMWSAGNEIGEQKQPNGYEVLRSLMEIFHREDPTRPVTTGNDNIAADNGSATLPFLEMLDIVGYNYVDRWHKRRELFYDIDRHDHPNWKMTGTESVSIPGIRGNYYGGFFGSDSSAIRPANMASVVRAEQLWKFVSDHDYVIGDFMWTGIDYLGEAFWPGKNASSGVIDLCGFPKDGYYFYQSQWTTKPMIHLFPHWNWKGKEGRVIQVMAYTNCDSVELFLNGRSFGIKALDFPRQGNSGAWNKYDRPQINTTTGDLHLMWDVPYEAGTLKAVGRKGGKIVVTEEIKTTGEPVAIRLSVDRKIINADQRDAVHVKVEIVDEHGYVVPDANQLVELIIEEEGTLIGFDNGNPSDHTSMKSNQRKTFNGLALAVIQSKNKEGMIRVKANSQGLRGSTIEIITKKTGEAGSSTKKSINKKETGEILGADISFLPQLEDRGIKFSDKGVQKDAIEILKDHGFNYIRLRIFNNPAADSGYSPKKGFCDLEHTKQMAKRIKAAGMKFLLDFHYSDTWADPGKQFKPFAWKGIGFSLLKDSIYQFTKKVIAELKMQGTEPDMVQIGNEINHGMIWPDGSAKNKDTLTQFIKAGIAGVTDVDPSIIIMLHIACGGQNKESTWFLDNMISHNVSFDVIGQSYYPRWHGTLDDLKNNLSDLAYRYSKEIIVVEYSEFKKDVNQIAFELPNDLGKGTFIWEPLNTWEKVFDEKGNSNALLLIYDEISRKFLKK